MRDRVEQLEEALEENSDRLDEILKLLKKKTKYQCSSSDEEPEMTKKYVRDRSKTTKNRAGSPSPITRQTIRRAPSPQAVRKKMRPRNKQGQIFSKERTNRSRRRGQIR